MIRETIAHAGWARNLRLANDHIELITTLDVGPRILSLQHPGGKNVFKNFEKQLGQWGEAEWMIRGGHRFWIAPEDLERTYHIDNHPLEYDVDSETGEVIFDSVQEAGGRIVKSLGITLAKDSPSVTVRHTARNLDKITLEFSAWALSVMRPGGIEVIPQPQLGEHPRDLLPNRTMVLWPYTDLSDPRWYFGRDFITLRQSGSVPPTKIGLAHRERWVAYILDDSIFIKSFAHLEGETYPDGGCNFETFTNDEMLEIESLSPLKKINPGESITLTEQWHLYPLEKGINIESEASLKEWITPYLAQSGIL